MLVLHGNGEDIYFLISPTLPISHTPGASFTITITTPKITPDFQPFAQHLRQNKAVNEELRRTLFWGLKAQFKGSSLATFR
ncbi:MAG: hypothetical protein F6K22_01525 [Okeania sp. SIO2F4]|uniref:hypothetical protein n=1 Tax=Okeania sp. SIO2F4 TaxID=2607790 RepID=UPI00142BD7E7|nr:hypothetical protein [Okeania sp. SIO2F4]NES01625.1 hypothetical protein [Okeania sp. SIO2F4]